MRTRGIYDNFADDSSSSSSDDLIEMTSGRAFTSRVQSECFNTGAIGIDAGDDSENGSDTDITMRSTIFSGGYSISKENEM